MEKEQMQRLQAILQRQVGSVLDQRFRIKDYSESDTYEMLLMCYRAEVAKRNISFSDDQQTRERVAKCAKWLCGDYKPGLMLFGRIGSGKSTLARAICQLIGMLYDSNSGFYSDRKTVARISALDMTSIVRDEDGERFRRIKQAAMLFIDDIGLEPPTVKVYGNEFTPVVDLVYARYDNQRFTIVTSNLRGDEFRQRYGDRVGDRMLEMFETVEFTQTMSYRK